MAEIKRFPWGFVTAAAIAFLILIGLGIWQLQRLAWKENLLAEIAAQFEASAVPLPQTLDQPDDWEYRRVIITGRYLHDKERHLYRTGPDGGPGYYVFTPLERSEGDVVMVNRGWVPEWLRDPADRAEGQVAGAVTIEGVVRLGEKPSGLRPANEDAAAANTYLLADPARMAQDVGIGAPAYYVAASEAAPGGWPRGVLPRVDIPNNHLQYAITWFALALVLLVISTLYVRRRGRS